MCEGRTQKHLLRQCGQGTAEVGPHKKPPKPGGGWHKVSVPHQATLRRLPLAHTAGQQQAGSSKRTQLSSMRLFLTAAGAEGGGDGGRDVLLEAVCPS